MPFSILSNRPTAQLQPPGAPSAAEDSRPHERLPGQFGMTVMKLHRNALMLHGAVIQRPIQHGLDKRLPRLAHSRHVGQRKGRSQRLAENVLVLCHHSLIHAAVTRFDLLPLIHRPHRLISRGQGTRAAIPTPSF